MADPQASQQAVLQEKQKLQQTTLDLALSAEFPAPLKAAGLQKKRRRKKEKKQ